MKTTLKSANMPIPKSAILDQMDTKLKAILKAAKQLRETA